MYQYSWDAETGGLLLSSQQSKFSKEPRPVYYRELNILGMNSRWSYPQNDDAPIMWAEANNYIYRGRTIAKTKGGSLYTHPEVIYTTGEEEEPEGAELVPVDVAGMVRKNRGIMNSLVEETAQTIYKTYNDYRSKIDLFYVAFSGGKDSIVTLDLVQRTLPHDSFKVVFGDTQMEFPDTYDTVDNIEVWCKEHGIDFLRACSKMKPSETWALFGPPATSIRWCCSVHKTTPQILLLRNIYKNPYITGMAFTGIRADESVARSNYNEISEGKKHQGQYSCHAIFNWSSAELFIYILSNKLILSQSYYKGIPRAGCLVCPNSAGKAEYFKYVSYPHEMNFYLDIIAKTSNKSAFSKEQMDFFIDQGKWRTRKTGRELCFGLDRFEYSSDSNGHHTFHIHDATSFPRWLQWLKTIGSIEKNGDDSIEIHYCHKTYCVKTHINENDYDVVVYNCFISKEDVRFLYLLRSTLIKSLYCVSCGECEAECKSDCIHCDGELTIGSNCTHCHRCHDVCEHCVHYYSLRNKSVEGKKMGAIDRYASFGFRGIWLDTFIKYNGNADFWNSDIDGYAPNKRKDKCYQFLLDAGIIEGKRTCGGENYSDVAPSKFGYKLCDLRNDAIKAWALILVNLIANPQVPTFRWFINNVEIGSTADSDSLKFMLEPMFRNDIKGHGKQNVVDSIKIILATTPLGTQQILSNIDCITKSSSKGETITLNSITRTPWLSPIPEVILYSLYKFAEACDGYYQFSLTALMDNTIEREGVSPSRIFGLDRDTMIRICNGLAINYPDFIAASFTFDLDTITLRKEKTSMDVLDLLA